MTSARPISVNADDERWMLRALDLARSAERLGEVPVGAVLVRDGAVLGEGYNCLIATCDPSAHAEVIALRRAGGAAHNYRLPGSTLYVTLEPCLMCVGVLAHARVQRLVYGASDTRWGADGSAVGVLKEGVLNHRCEVSPGVLADRCAGLLDAFFDTRRLGTPVRRE